MLVGAEKGMIQNWAVQIACKNVVNDKPINKDILLACLDIAIEFKKDADKRIDNEFNDKPKISKIDL